MSESVKKTLDEARNSLKSIQDVQFDTNYYLFKYFQKLKTDVELRRKELKEKIDQFADEIIQDISKTQQAYMKLSNDGISQVGNKLEAIKIELNRIVQCLSCFEINYEVCKEHEDKMTILRPRVDDLVKEFEVSLTGNNRYEFKKTSETDQLKELFGSFVRIPLNLQFRNSEILDKKSWTDLMNLCNFAKDQKWLLLYRATSDGFSAKSFHAKCDGIKQTLTIIKSDSDCVFGGYTENSWGSEGRHKEDPDAFIFSLVNKENFPFLAKCIEAKKAIMCHMIYGPTFGVLDFFLQSESNQSQFSRSNLGFSYSHSEFPKRSTRAKTILAGAEFFLTKEIEVYCKQNNLN